MDGHVQGLIVRELCIGSVSVLALCEHHFGEINLFMSNSGGRFTKDTYVVYEPCMDAAVFEKYVRERCIVNSWLLTVW